MARPRGKKGISDELYQAIVDAERATRKAYDMCYVQEGIHNANRFTAIQLGNAQSLLMKNVVKYANREK